MFLSCLPYDRCASLGGPAMPVRREMFNANSPKIAATVTTVKDRGSQMNNISWRVFTKGKVWYWEREDNFTVLRTGPFSSFSACAADAKRSKKDDLESDKLFKVAKRPNRKYESKSTASQQR